VLVQEGKLACASLPPWWDDFQDVLVLVQEEKLAFSRCACAFARGKSKAKLAFLPRWNDVVSICTCACSRGKASTR
jgi:hypothetical protein